MQSMKMAFYSNVAAEEGKPRHHRTSLKRAQQLSTASACAVQVNVMGLCALFRAKRGFYSGMLILLYGFAYFQNLAFKNSSIPVSPACSTDFFVAFLRPNLQTLAPCYQMGLNSNTRSQKISRTKKFWPFVSLGTNAGSLSQRIP